VSGHSSARPRRQRFAQHFLRSAPLAAELVGRAEIHNDECVVEFGAGHGALTAALATRAHHVLAIEIDETLVDALSRRFATTAAVTVVHGDALEVPLPATPYRVMANVPFNRTTAILRRLLETPNGALVRADLLVQWEVARKRARVESGPPLDLLGAVWGPWWTFARGRRLPASLFRPSPSVDAGVLTVTRRSPALLPASEQAGFAAFVRRAFAGARVLPVPRPFRSAGQVDPLDAGVTLGPAAAPRDVGVGQWVQLYQAATSP